MEFQLPKEVQDGLDAARKSASRAARRLRIRTAKAQIPVLRAWEGGFALDPASASGLRGRVALYDGARLVLHGLIIASEEDGKEIRFEYKRMTDATGEQPLDFYRAPDTPMALLAKPGDY